MLELLGEHGDIDTVANTVAGETGESSERVGADLEALCESLAERGLIVFEPAA